jgi:hypothetical protein
MQFHLVRFAETLQSKRAHGLGLENAKSMDCIGCGFVIQAEFALLSETIRSSGRDLREGRTMMGRRKQGGQGQLFYEFRLDGRFRTIISFGRSGGCWICPESMRSSRLTTPRLVALRSIRC